ncbi:hypothetical protein [Yoonia sp. SS1-5]|uniref:Uncharacterized protein n=1 Tax=Yoonia rhodophyticola TaxID=3137370 RepID=A0AAN0M8J5_9RHOB
MEQRQKQTVAGIYAPPPRPTPLGAALVAALVTAPFALIVLLLRLLG